MGGLMGGRGSQSAGSHWLLRAVLYFLGLVGLALWGLGLYLGTAYAQTPVVDDAANSKLSSIESAIGTTNTRLGNLEGGVVTVQEAQATQTALLGQMVGTEGGAVNGWRLDVDTAWQQSTATLIQGLVVLNALMLVVQIATMIVKGGQ